MFHAGRRAKRRDAPVLARQLRPAAVVVAGLAVALVGTFLWGRAAGTARSEAEALVGVVTDLADGGRVLCLDPDGTAGRDPFCDLYYLPPDIEGVRVGDRVHARTITSTDADGELIAGLLVTAVERD